MFKLYYRISIEYQELASPSGILGGLQLTSPCDGHRPMSHPWIVETVTVSPRDSKRP